MNGPAVTKGLPPIPDDDATVAVLESAVSLVLRRRLAADDLRGIAAFAIRMKLRFGPERAPVREAEAVVREALGEAMPTKDIPDALRFQLMTLAFSAAVEELGLFHREVGALLADAERLAVLDGHQPTTMP
jgi:hypothetical protein